jgi:hypothetical protein
VPPGPGGAPLPRFELRYADGEDAGTFRAAAPNWSTGDTFQTGDGRKLRILRTIPIDKVAEFVDKPAAAIWEVEPAD